MRKFLKIDDMELTIKDETKLWKQKLKEKREQEAKRISIDKEATERIIKNTLGEQIKRDEEKRRKQGKKKTMLVSSSSESSDAE